MTKRDALAAHQTQYGYSANRLLPLVRSNELFGDLAPVRLAAPGATAVIDDDLDGPEPVEGEERWEGDWTVPEDDVTRRDSRPGAVKPSSAHLGDGGAATEVDLQRLTLRLEEAALVLEAQTARPLSELQSLQLFLAGHRLGVPSASMPKLARALAFRSGFAFISLRTRPQNPRIVITWRELPTVRTLEALSSRCES